MSTEPVQEPADAHLPDNLGADYDTWQQWGETSDGDEQHNNQEDGW